MSVRTVRREPTVASPPPAAPPTRGRMFASLRHRNYRLLWIGTVVSSSGDWMDIAALYYLVYDLTHNAGWLAAYSFMRAAPILCLTLFGGVVADRFERRKLLFATQTFAMTLAVGLAVLVSGGWINIWEVLLIGFGRGVMMAFNQPARQSLISELVPPADLQNAIALSSASFNLTRIVGPMIGALSIAIAGLQGAFWLNAASFIVLLWSLFAMKFPPQTRAVVRKSVLSSLGEGIGYIRRHGTLGPLVLLATTPWIFGMTYQYILPVFAKDILKVGARGDAFLLAASGCGGFAAALAIAARSGKRNRGLQMLWGLALFGGALVLFAESKLLPLSLIAMFGAGVGQMTYMATNNSLVQEIVDPEYRGRVLSTLSINMGFAPLGTAFASGMIAAFGAPTAQAVMGGALVLIAVVVGLRFRVVRGLH